MDLYLEKPQKIDSDGIVKEILRNQKLDIED
jgi:hypothetical protein